MSNELDSKGLQSANFIDLVVLKNHLHVFQAPAFSQLKEGDKVIIESIKEDETAIVERVYTARKSGDELDFILIASGTSLPLRKILKKIDYKDFDFKDGTAYEKS